MKHIIFSALTVAALTSPASAEAIRPSVTVRGTCLKFITPDRGSVTLTARVIDKDAGTAVQRATDTYNKLLERSKALNLKNAEYNTSAYSVNEEYDWSNNKRTSKGFAARMSLDISSSEIKRLGEIIKIGADLKLEEGGSLSTFVSDNKLKTEREGCLEEATRNARLKAESMAKGAGVKLGKILDLSEEGTTSPQPPIMYASKRAMLGAEASDAVPAGIEARDTKLTVNIEATFALE